MVKRLENKLNRLVDNSDPQELEDKIVKYTNEAIDDAILNGNKNDGLEKMKTSVKFLQDHQYDHPNTLIRAWRKINVHLSEILSKALEDVLLSHHEIKILINGMAIIDLIYLNIINKLLISYQEEKNELYINAVLEQINELKRMKITLLKNQNLSEALNELKKESQDHPEFDEKLHEELVKDVKKSIQDHSPKTD